MRLPFGAASAGDILQRKIEEIFKGLPNVFGFAGDISVVGYDSDVENHDDIVQKVLEICRQVNMKRQMLFQMQISTIF